MAAKVFTEEQRKILSKNPNVESVEKTRIIYTEAFKSYYVKNYLAGKKPTEIFIEAGFDPSILGNKRIERASARWRKLYADGQLIIDTKENISVETKEEKIMNSEPTKKRRGRPRKNPEVVSQETTENKAKTVKKRVNKIAAMAQNIKLAEPVVKKEVKEEAPQKKRRGRPPKNAQKAVETKVETKVEKVETQVKANEQVAKKRRGRPPKNAQKAVETKVETKVEKVETQVKANEQVAKKRRGRPRKIVQNVDETPVQKKENIEVKPVVKAKEESISKVEKVEKVETVEQANPVAALVKAINRLTREVNSLKRLVAGKKRINY